MVSDLLCPLTNKWDIDKIRSILPQYEESILQIKTSSTPATDKMVWLPEKSGQYSTKTGFGVGIMSNRLQSVCDEPVDWVKHIWNIKTSPKLKDF